MLRTQGLAFQKLNVLNICFDCTHHAHKCTNRLPHVPKPGLVEYMLEQDVKQEGAMRALVDFPLYYVPLFIAEDDSPNFALAPDTDNRTLIAVFTTEDNLDVYLETAKQKISSNVQVQVMGGQSLFSAIQDLDIDGIVINCLGPSKPHGLALQLINMALLTTQQPQQTEEQTSPNTQEH